MVAEVISPSSLIKDRREKFEIYEVQGVKYHIIIDPGFNKVENFELIRKACLAVAVNSDYFTFTFEDGCPASVNFTGLFED